MNKTFLYLLAIAMFFVACNQNEPTHNDCDDEPKNSSSFVLALASSNVNISSDVTTDIEVATVRAIVSALQQDTDGRTYWTSNEIAYANFHNGVINLYIPETVPIEYLGSMFELFGIFSYEGITVSDIQTKTGNVWLYAYDIAGNYVGDFKFISDGWFAEFMLSDRDFSVKGNLRSGSAIDSDFHKGLNIEYSMWGGNTKSTTNQPLSENFKWILEPPPTVGF